VTLLDEEVKKSKKFTESCKQQNDLLPLHSQIGKKSRNRKGFSPGDAAISVSFKKFRLKNLIDFNPGFRERVKTFFEWMIIDSGPTNAL
jgi:hypothetical protein